ncbi:prokaryotic molybdopterin-containing oxidoreductase family, iron-sulfur binding subunit [Xaviernesmea oryzae]|uniref:Prokaryotic molybdopterin-containing oxidoreductase family, iron-sulfur binding subunit n=1 Tax=Xaviernesmea oryzae TaxID=464029 RepID=A0A1X7GPX5_9HYPH|nr:TAT-variant-translocated molybdopterin oxidoreductase [Xaviernesmea oryzae]SMF72853.1 prokaryotic molybdopterin-containing oxidoreductase family, iron-sulfur binding subunit [Xaviernesmea oryzae]
MSAVSSNAIETMQAKLKGRTGRQFWRSLEELTGTAEFRNFMEERLPSLAVREIDRRTLLKVMGASLALAGLSACKGEADEKAYPYVNMPEGMTLGEARWYATAVGFAGYAQPVLGKTFAGRPVKLEGNPDHPASRGATDAFTQAALLGLYDPGRSQAPRHFDKPADWNAFDAAMAQQAGNLDAVQGDRFRLLTGPTSSPTLLRRIALLMERWPKARWHICDPVPADGRTAATEMIFGRPMEMHAAFERAEVIVSFDDDFLGPGPSQTRNAGLFADRRRMRQQGQGPSRLMVAEPVLSITGSSADRRVAASVDEISTLLQALGAEFGIGSPPDSLSDRHRNWLSQVATALRGAGGRSLVLAGSCHSPDLQALALLINERLGSLGGTLSFSDPIPASAPDGARSLDVLAEDMRAGRVTVLAVLGANPVHAAPGDLDFAKAMDRVGLRIHAGLYDDETAALCHWHVPLQHDLESWSDARAVDGSIVLIQPLVRPFFDVRSPHVVLENLLGRQANDRELVQATWRQAWSADFDDRWRASLDKGFVEGSALPLSVPPIVDRAVSAPPVPASGMVLHIRPDAGVWDGALADNAWAQETPRPISKITWGNVVGVSPDFARDRGLANGDEVRVSVAGQSILGAIWIIPGQAAETISLTLGYGRSHRDSIAAGLGYNANILRSTRSPWHIAGAEIEKTGERQPIATTQAHQAMDGFDFVRTVEAEDVQVASAGELPSFYPRRPMEDPSWGMSIDLDLCIGCNACVTACQAENNIPVVGKELVAQGREMHWLRIDHYFEGEADAPKSYHQPVTCMHCEQAPCEMGCPVNAAVHSIDGLNLQVYNRCIGTRTCSSYCPYKVRRFNWFDFTGDDPPSIQAMRNPDVTVRSRGVMEKCTYCVQRIAEARIAADKEGRPIRDGEVVTACQQACPAQAITFGNVADPNSTVSRRKAEARDYALLEEVNTRPRTTYLARIEASGTSGEDAG